MRLKTETVTRRENFALAEFKAGTTAANIQNALVAADGVRMNPNRLREIQAGAKRGLQKPPRRKAATVKPATRQAKGANGAQAGV